jgi:hypothetical protein
VHDDSVGRCGHRSHSTPLRSTRSPAWPHTQRTPSTINHKVTMDDQQ